MAKPDLDDGWLKYAHELDAALALGDFNKHARIVLRVVFAQLFGPAKLPRARLSAAAIGREVGHPRQNIDRGIRELLDSSVLVREAEMIYVFRKDYETWRSRDGSPRFNATEIAWIKNATRMALSYKHTSGIKFDDKASSDQQSSGIKSDDKAPDSVIRFDDNPPSDNHASGIKFDDDLSSDLMTKSSPPLTTPPGEQERRKKIPPPPPSYHVGPTQPTTIPAALPGENASPSEDAPLRSARVPTHSPEQLARLVAWVREILGERAELECFAGKVAGYARSYPLDWIEQAVLRAHSNASPGKLDSYVNAVLIGWFPDGPPKRIDPRAVVPRRATPTPPVFTSTAAPKRIVPAPDRNGKPNRGDLP